MLKFLLISGLGLFVSFAQATDLDKALCNARPEKCQEQNAAPAPTAPAQQSKSPYPAPSGDGWERYMGSSWVMQENLKAALLSTAYRNCVVNRTEIVGDTGKLGTYWFMRNAISIETSKNLEHPVIHVTSMNGNERGDLWVTTLPGGMTIESFRVVYSTYLRRLDVSGPLNSP